MLLIQEYEDKLLVKKKEYEEANAIVEKLELKVSMAPHLLTTKQRESYDIAYVEVPKLQTEVEGLTATLRSYKDELASIKI